MMHFCPVWINVLPLRGHGTSGGITWTRSWPLAGPRPQGVVLQDVGRLYYVELQSASGGFMPQLQGASWYG